MAEAQHWEALRKQRLLDRKREYNNVKEGLYRYWSTSKDVYNVRSFYFIRVAKPRYGAYCRLKGLAPAWELSMYIQKQIPTTGLN